MASSLSSYLVDAFDDKSLSQLAKPTGQLAATLEKIAVKRGLEFDSDLKKSVYLWAGSGIVLLHLAALWAYLNYESPAPVSVKKHEVAIEFIKAEPPPVVEPPPPPPPPPPPKVQKVAPPPQPIAALKTAPAVESVAPTDVTVQENTHAEATSAPVMAASGPVEKDAPMPEVVPPPPPKVEEAVIEASANAAYLNNPKPDYPGAALRNGWGGTVVLRVRVLANGSPESATVKKSTGKKILDDAAINTVMKWTFVPSKRGSTPVDGWATVPIIFNPEQ